MQKKFNITEEDLKVLNFILEFKMLKVEDASLIYKTKRYYRERVNKLISMNYVKRYKSYIVIDKNGRKVLGKVGDAYIKNIKNEAYMERLRNIASIAAITINSDVGFTPSWNIKDKDKFTDTARRYCGEIIFDGKRYLVYYISKKKEHVYIKQLLFDVNKSVNNENIIIFTDDYNVINKKYSYFAFGKTNTYVIKNTNEFKELLRNYSSIDIHELLENIYKQEVYISDWNIADYVLGDNKYIINMLFINSELIQKINWYFEENSNSKRKLEIVTVKENTEKLKEILSDRCTIKEIDNYLLKGVYNES